MFPTEDTIAAIASAPGHAQRGIIRLSGPQVMAGLARVVTNIEATLSTVTRATVLPVAIQADHCFPEINAHLYYWPDHRSYTRQCSAELHLPGAPSILKVVLTALCRNETETVVVRVAQPGEFTLRAFLAGRIDLTQAEAVLGVIDAQDKKELQLALSQLAGGLNLRFQNLRDQLLTLLAELEAGLDFTEEDIQFIEPSEIQRQITRMDEELTQIALQLSCRLQRPAEYRIVLRGQTNAGKSSLFNALAQQTIAIVSDIPGTTRDYVSHSLTLAKLPCLLIDTAGFQQGEDLDEHRLQREIQDMTNQQQQHAHLEIFCVNGTDSPSQWDREQLQVVPDHARIVVNTRADCAGFKLSELADVATSVTSEMTSGIDQLCELIGHRINQQAGETMVLQQTASRCEESLDAAIASVRQALVVCQQEQGDELLAAELHNALQQLGLIVGTVYSDDILERIFSTFCIGK